jgi:hypothetical protein
MMYRFRSQATGDVLMMQATGDVVLRLLGREPAERGIIEVAHMADAIARLQAASAASAAAPDAAPGDDAADDDAQRGVGLRQRLWPMIEMLRRAQAAGEPVVWGV